MAIDNFSQQRAITSPSDDWVNVTPDNSNDLEKMPRAVYSHDGGHIVCQSRAGNIRRFLFAAGEIKPIRPARILVSFGSPEVTTTSTDIAVLY